MSENSSQANERASELVSQVRELEASEAQLREPVTSVPESEYAEFAKSLERTARPFRKLLAETETHLAELDARFARENEAARNEIVAQADELRAAIQEDLRNWAKSQELALARERAEAEAARARAHARTMAWVSAGILSISLSGPLVVTLAPSLGIRSLVGWWGVTGGGGGLMFWPLITLGGFIWLPSQSKSALLSRAGIVERLTPPRCLAALLLGFLLALFAPLALAALCIMAVLVVVGLVIGFNNK